MESDTRSLLSLPLEIVSMVIDHLGSRDLHNFRSSSRFLYLTFIRPMGIRLELSSLDTGSLESYLEFLNMMGMGPTITSLELKDDGENLSSNISRLEPVISQLLKLTGITSIKINLEGSVSEDDYLVLFDLLPPTITSLSFHGTDIGDSQEDPELIRSLEIWSPIIHLTSLQSLVLEDCHRLSCKILHSISFLNLKSLELTLSTCPDSQSEGLLPLFQLGELTSLTSLKIKDYKLVGSPDSWIPDGVVLRQISRLTSLTSLDIDTDTVTHPSEARYLGKLTSLTSLRWRDGWDLDYTNMLESLTNLTSLTSLSLEHYDSEYCEFKFENFSRLRTLSMLRSLTLPDDYPSPSQLFHLLRREGLPQLKELRLGKRDVSSIIRDMGPSNFPIPQLD